jgi:hypothetical protein
MDGNVASVRPGELANDSFRQPRRVTADPLLTFGALNWSPKSGRSPGTPHELPGAGGRERGTSAASRCVNSSGDSTGCVMPSRQGILSFGHHLPGGVAPHPFVGQRRAGDIAAKLLQRLAVVGITARRRGGVMHPVRE